MAKTDLIEQDIQAIIQAGGTDKDVESYLKDTGVSYNLAETSTKPKDQFLPGREKAESLRGSREPIDLSFAKKVSAPLGTRDIVNPGGRLVDILSGIIPASQMIESSLASGGLKAQEGSGGRDIVKSFFGEDVIKKPAQFGDIPRSAGVPEPLSAAIGLGTAMATPDILSKGGLGRGIEKGGKVIAQKAANPFVNLSTNIGNVSKPANFAGKIRNAFFDAKKVVSRNFDSWIDQQTAVHPENKIDLKPMFDDFKNVIDDVVNNPGLKSEIKSIARKSKSDLLPKLLDNPSLAENLTLREAQDIKNAINQAPTIARKAGNKFANWTQGEGELLDLVDEIKLKIMDDFPGMKPAYQQYADKMGQYRLIKNKFKEGSLIRNLKTGFGDPEIQNMVKSYFKDNPSIIKEIGGYEKTLKLLKAFGITAGGAVGYEMIKKLLKGQH